jgi:hypothetical protein
MLCQDCRQLFRNSERMIAVLSSTSPTRRDNPRQPVPWLRCESGGAGADFVNYQALSLPRIRARTSSRVSFSRKAPSMGDVIVEECCFSTPRIIMHKFLASTITPTPSGFMALSIASAICVVRRSYTCNRRANTSTKRGTLLSPITLPRGI